MIASIRGKITEITDRYAIVDIQGLGYKVFATHDALHGLKVGKEASFFTHLAVREDALDLYGFATNNEKNIFELLISISGIGPKTALNILSLVSGDALMNAIQTGSTAHLIKVSGIGKKTAEKIVLELRDKIDSIESSDMSPGMSSDLDAIEALKALGYDADEARQALKKISSDISDTGAKVKAALKLLGK